MHRYLVLLFVMALAANGQWPLSFSLAEDKNKDKDKITAEDKKFEGVWQVTAMEAGGKKIPKAEFQDMTFEFRGKKYWQRNGGTFLEVGTQDLDPSKEPKSMEVTVIVGLGLTRGQKQLAIYEIEGDKLKVCAANHGDRDRPTKFSTEKGSKQIYFELKRKGK